MRQKIKQTLLSLCLSILLFFSAQVFVFAQSDEQIAKEYGITFPIEELGNCVDLEQCKKYCDVPDNQDACVNYAKEKGFYKESQQPPQSASPKSDEEILQLAKVELGCSSYEQCMSFCDQKGNWKKCEEFAFKHGLGGEEMQKMREAMDKLGCDSPSLCMSFCSEVANMQKCAEVFQSVGYGGNVSTSSESPEVWCPKAGREGETCVWDGNQCTCWNPKECESYPGCKFTGSSCECSLPEQNIGEECNKQPGCKWTGSDCECTSNIEPPEVWCPKLSTYCVWDGSSCTCWDDCVKAGGTWTGSRCDYPGSAAEPGEVWCPKAGSGCTWDGSQCTCFETTTQSSDQTVTQEAPEVWCPRNPGCSWDAAAQVCSCQVIQQDQPSQKEIEKQACETDKVCSWNGEFCVCPDQQSVQGVKTNRGLLQQIIDFLLGR